MHFFAGISAPMGKLLIFALTASLSPVNEPCSTHKVKLISSQMRISAGTLSPALTSTISPGTSPSAGKFATRLLSQITTASSDWISWSACQFFLALFSCQTPNIALTMRIKRTTSGASDIITLSLLSSPSKMARIRETKAATRRIQGCH